MTRTTTDTDTRTVTGSEPVTATTAVTELLNTPVTASNDPAFTLSHPKNYVGGAIAVAATGATGAVIPQHLTRLAGAVRRGCTALHLTGQDGALTDRGDVVVARTRRTHGTADNALRALGELHGDGTRFTDAQPEWTGVTQAVLATHPFIHTVLRNTAATPHTVLPEIVAERSENDDAAGVHAFTGTTTARVERGDVDLHSTGTYRSVTISHIKTMCYHAGLLTEPGTTTDTHRPATDRWALDAATIRDDIHDHITTSTPAAENEGEER